jgi:hypothetical protein
MTWFFLLVCVAAQPHECGYIDRTLFPPNASLSKIDCESDAKAFGYKMKLPKNKWVIVCQEAVPL